MTEEEILNQAAQVRERNKRLQEEEALRKKRMKTTAIVALGLLAVFFFGELVLVLLLKSLLFLITKFQWSTLVAPLAIVSVASLAFGFIWDRGMWVVPGFIGLAISFILY